MSTDQEDNAVYRHGEQFSQQLAKGLADNWSQVGQGHVDLVFVLQVTYELK